jgi:hypothetical protein
MRQFTDEEKKMIWKEILEEFPDDVTMQEVHYVRLLHYYQTKDMTPRERIVFFSNFQKENKENRDISS